MIIQHVWREALSIFYCLGKLKEVVHCEDGVKDFLHGMGIASECKFFNWDMPLKNSMVTERSIACKRMDGGHEIVPGYHNID